VSLTEKSNESRRPKVDSGLKRKFQTSAYVNLCPYYLQMMILVWGVTDRWGPSDFKVYRVN
jgi:hypothetical protein